MGVYCVISPADGRKDRRTDKQRQRSCGTSTRLTLPPVAPSGYHKTVADGVFDTSTIRHPILQHLASWLIPMSTIAIHTDRSFDSSLDRWCILAKMNCSSQEATIFRCTTIWTAAASSAKNQGRVKSTRSEAFSPVAISITVNRECNRTSDNSREHGNGAGALHGRYCCQLLARS